MDINNGNSDLLCKNIRIHHECVGGIEKPIARITDWQNEACQVMTNGDPEGRIFLVADQTAPLRAGCVNYFVCKCLLKNLALLLKTTDMEHMSNHRRKLYFGICIKSLISSHYTSFVLKILSAFYTCFLYS